jgi:hypothetical protein
MSVLVQAFEELIPAQFRLAREGDYWIIKEPRAGNSRLEIAGGKSHAFTLDKSGGNVFPFFSDQLKGMKSVNDAIIIAVVGKDTYMIAVEMKTGKIGDALKQIESGRLFSTWVRQLLSFYGHWKGDSCKFFGVVSLKPRKQERKGSTRRSAELPAPDLKDGYLYFVLRNHPRASIADLADKIMRTNNSYQACV